MKMKLDDDYKVFLEAPLYIDPNLLKNMIKDYEKELAQVKLAIQAFLEKLSYQHDHIKKDGHYTVYENGKIWVYTPMNKLVYKFQCTLFQRNLYVPLDVQKSLQFELLMSIYFHTRHKLFLCHKMLDEEWERDTDFVEVTTPKMCKHLKDYVAPEDCEQFPWSHSAEVHYDDTEQSEDEDEDGCPVADIEPYNENNES